MMPIIEIDTQADDHVPPPPSKTHNIEAMLIKQGKQIRALYELQKLTFEKVTIVQTQVKKFTSTKNTDLNQKVFNVSNHNIFYVVILLITKYLDIVNCYISLNILLSYRYIIRMHIAQHAQNFSQKICGRGLKNLKNH